MREGLTDILAGLFSRQQPQAPEWWADDYFHGYRSHLPHPMQTSTGSEGRCDICGGYSDDRRHDKPWRRITEHTYGLEQARSVGSDPLGPLHPQHDVSFYARQARLDALPDPGLRTTSPSDSGEKQETASERALRQATKDLEFVNRYGGKPNITIPKEANMLRINRSWGPEYLVKSFFEQDDVWITARGDWIKVPDMDLDHILNTLLMLERVADDLPFPAEELQSKPLYQAMYDRLKLAVAPEEKDESQATVRKLYQAVTNAPDIEAMLRASMTVSSRAHKGQVLHLDYTDDKGDRTYRRILPLSFNKVGALQPVVVVARDVDKNELRTFRLDRINSVGP